MPKYFIKTYGCQMNKGDSVRLASILEDLGYKEAKSREEADILFVNTCVVRQNAEDKASGYIKSAKNLKKMDEDVIIGVCGCIVTDPNRNVRKDFPHVDIFIPPGSPEMVLEYLKPIKKTETIKKSGKKRKGEEGITKYVTIMEGCDNFCSYCIVPYVRGREKSRLISEILEEIKGIDTKKYKEIFLLGQNVNSYEYGLAKLLREIEKTIDPVKFPIERIRFMTSHPKDMTDEIIDSVLDLPHVCEFFHLPIQHGDDEILKKMNRPYTLKEYKALVDKIRTKMPDAAITSDVIVGFPGETEKEFENTCNIIREIGFDASNTLAYSVRRGTAASKLEDDVSEATKQRRLQEVMKIVNEVAEEKNKKLVGKTLEVLVELQDKKDKKFMGRTRTNKIVKFPHNDKKIIGKLVNVKITSAKAWVLRGSIV